MTISGKSAVTAVIGGNISGSLSPVIHNIWYQDLGIDGVYVPFQSTVEAFKENVNGLFGSGVNGLNVTVPLKEEAYKFADILTEEAQQAEAVNCLYIGDDGKVIGHNTDGIGFIASVKALDPAFDFTNANVLVLGAGGAASGIISGLKQLGVKKFDVLNRTFSKAESLATLFSDGHTVVKAFDSHDALKGGYDLILNTTTLKKVIPNGLNELPLELLKNSNCVIDINYGFAPNLFLDRAKAQGCKTCDGIEMLVQQARPSFQLFNRSDLPETTDALYQALNKAMGI